MTTIEEPTKVAAVVGAWHKASQGWRWFLRDDHDVVKTWRGSFYRYTWDEITDPEVYSDVTVVFPGVDPLPPPLAEPQGLRAMVVGEWDDDGERTMLRLPNPSFPDNPWLCVETGGQWSWDGVVLRLRNLRIEHAGTTA